MDVDKQFMEVASTSVVFKDGRYHLPLSFHINNSKDRVMPHNYKMAEQRTLNLKELKKDVGIPLYIMSLLSEIWHMPLIDLGTTAVTIKELISRLGDIIWT